MKARRSKQRPDPEAVRRFCYACREWRGVSQFSKDRTFTSATHAGRRREQPRVPGKGATHEWQAPGSGSSPRPR
jgi:hypothetical protein